MTETREVEIKLIEKSIKAMRFCIESLTEGTIDEAISMYNTVLQGFESLQKIYKSYNGEITNIPDKLMILEKKHKKIINCFENNRTERLGKQIKESILTEYLKLEKLSNEMKRYEQVNINIKAKQFKFFRDAGYLNNISDIKTETIQNYWKKYFGKKVDPALHMAYEEVTDQFDVRVIPQHVIWHEIIPYLNDRNMMRFYSDKNVYDTLITRENHPEILLKRVNGQYFDSNNNTISRGRGFKLIFETKEDVIVKQSLSDDGKGIGKLKYKNKALYYKKKKFTLKEIEEVWGDNFLVQRVIQQHPVMAAPHKYSVNTVRMVTLRWDDNIHWLMSYARFGVGYSITDNAASEGLCVGILSDGTFQSFAIGTDAKVYHKHPTTNFIFADMEQIPNFNRVIQFVKKLHDRILHENYISWDIAIGSDGEPIFIEMNFWGAAWKYQLACKQPIFGEFTEEILIAVKKDREKRIELEKNKEKKKKLQEKVNS